MEQRGYKRDIYNGFGDGLARAFELAFTPAIFAVIGLVLDKVVGTVPLFTIVLAVFAFVGMFVRMWYGYDQAMQRQERNAGLTRPTAAPLAPAAPAAAAAAPKAAR